MRRFVCILLSLSLILCACGSKNAVETPSKEQKTELKQTSVSFPEKSDVQYVTEFVGSMAVQSYLVARTYLDKFLEYDIEKGSFEEYQSYLTYAMEAFETTDKLSESLTALSEMWIEEGISEKRPLMSFVNHKKEKLNPFTLVAYAADDSPAVTWAQDIVDKFDSAPAGKGIRTLSNYLATDAKKAYLQLQQAQEILNGNEYEKIADKANTAYKTAVVLKTTGTAAGLGLAIAAAPATTTLGAVISTGGTVMSGVNTILEIGSMSAVIYTNGEGNWVSEACDKTESQMAPIGAAFSFAGVCTNLSGFMKASDKILKEGVMNGKTSVKEMAGLLGKSKELTDDAFGMISYSVGAVNDLVSDGSILGGTFKCSDGSVKLTLVDTLTGKEEETKELLKQNGVPEETIEKALKETTEDFKYSESIPEEVGNSITAQTPELDPGSKDYDKELIENFIKTIDEIAGIIFDDEGEELSGTWVDPYEYFGVTNCEDLMSFLNDLDIQQIKVRPQLYFQGYVDHPTHTLTMNNEEPFVMSMVEGDKTVFSSTYTGEDETYYNFTLTLVKRSKYSYFPWDVYTVVDKTYTNGITDHDETDEGWVETNTGSDEELIRKGFTVIGYIGNELLLEIVEVLLP